MITPLHHFDTGKRAVQSLDRAVAQRSGHPQLGAGGGGSWRARAEMQGSRVGVGGLINRVNDRGLAESYLFGHKFDRVFLSLAITHPVM